MPTSQASRRPSTPWFVLAVTVGSVTLVRLPVLVGAERPLDIAVILLFAFMIGWNLHHQPRGSVPGRPMLLPLLYTLVLAITLVRGAVGGAYASAHVAAVKSTIYFLFVVFGATLVSSAGTRRAVDERLCAIALAPVAYIFVNAVLHVGGIENSIAGGATEGTSATFLSSLGLEVSRTRFPLATSINLFAIVAAAALVSAVILRIGPPARLSRGATGLAVAASLYCLLVSDSRGALLIAVLVAALILSRVRLPAILVAGIVPVLPVVVLGVLGLLSDLHVTSALSRGSLKGQEFATATGRLFIWQEAWGFLKHFQFHELYGWGAAGHFASGASFRWAPLVSSAPEAPKEIFTHDAPLQMVFDSGIVGLAILIFAIWTTWRRLQAYVVSTLDAAGPALLGILLVIVLSGATEVSPSYYTEEALLELLLIMGAAAGLARRIDLRVDPERGEATAEEVSAPTAAAAYSVSTFGRAESAL
jgi:O-antigen ligase